ncbi:MAG: AFG1 family ATPase [Cocleimonas sp.]|nr:AFG1 family ATPase [Cocleimonas sp.]
MKLTSNPTALQQENIDNLLITRYQMSIDAGELEADPFQRQIILALQVVYNTLLVTPSFAKTSFFKHFLPFIFRKPTPTTPIKKGLYIWGGVGRGKTLLVDYFFDLVPTKRKLRLHFHRFMQLVHEELGALTPIEDPLARVAKKLAGRIELLCLDEMHINDITDAMLLSKLLEHLFAKDIILVTTSNNQPTELYKNGLQRARFIPAIKLLEKYTNVVQMGGDEDYRLKTLEQSAIYHISNGKASECRLQTYFHQIAAIERHQDRHDIIIKQRRIPVKMWADGVVWFDFKQICSTARSTADYTQIANIFHTVLISDILIMETSMNDIARRFVNMIDEFYDRHVNLVISAQAAPEQLYTGKRLAFEFERTASRLREMRTEKYLAVKHLS